MWAIRARRRLVLSGRALRARGRAVERGDTLKPGKTLPSLAIVLALLLLCATGASAGGTKEEHSSLKRLRPPVGGITMSVVGGDRYLTLTNKTGKVVLVKGYDEEPYLRFLANGV